MPRRAVCDAGRVLGSDGKCGQCGRVRGVHICCVPHLVLGERRSACQADRGAATMMIGMSQQRSTLLHSLLHLRQHGRRTR